MKNFVFVSLFVLCSLIGNAQHYEVLDAEELWNSGVQTSYYCSTDDELLGIIVYGVGNYCSDQVWWLQDFSGILIDGINADSIVISNPHEYHEYQFTINGCYDIGGIPMFELTHRIIFDVLPLNPFDDPILWKRHNDTITLSAPWIYSPVWSPGGNTPNIETLEQGVYLVTLTNSCGSATYSVEVRDNVDLYRATVDLRTNKNKVTWQVTPEQAQYITSVKVYRDGVLIGTTPYTNGYFLDAIGSDAAARNYRIVGVAIEGDDCPIPSYEKGTIHTTYYEDVDANLNMTWNAPYVEEGAQGTLTGYQICKYNPATEDLTVVDQVNSSITDYTCNSSTFIGCRATVAAIFDSKDIEDRAFSNLTDHTFTTIEENGTNFKVYPNPANGTFTVEGATTLTIYNTLGQIIATSHSENEKHSFTVSSGGIYFIKSDEGAVQKIIVQ